MSTDATNKVRMKRFIKLFFSVLCCVSACICLAPIWYISRHHNLFFLGGAALDVAAKIGEPGMLVGLSKQIGLTQKENRVPGTPRFRSSRCDDKPIRVAVVGGGVSGSTTAYSLLESNKARRCSDGNEAPANSAPFFNVTLFESTGRIGGHAWTVFFPTADGHTYPVDVGFAWAPTKAMFQPLRRLYRKFGVNLTGPLNHNTHVFRTGFEEITDETHAKHDKECDRLLEIIKEYKGDGKLKQILLGGTTLRSFWSMHKLTDAFFMDRLYPLIRFLIVSGSKGHIMDAPALAGLDVLINGWCGCHRHDLSADDWYNVAGGSASETNYFAAALEGHVRLNSPVTSLSEPNHQGARTLSYLPDGRAKAVSEVFDAVVLTAPPRHCAQILGDAAPSWLSMCTEEEIQVAVHSDTSVLGPIPKDVNTVYIIAGKDVGYGSGMGSILWDGIHNDMVHPRPIVTYNAERWNNGLPLKGEIFRTKFKHLQAPSLSLFLAATQGVAHYHNLPNASVFFAGAWVQFGFSHWSGVVTGWDAARAVGARPDKDDFFMTGDQYGDYPGWQEQCVATKGGLFKRKKNKI